MIGFILWLAGLICCIWCIKDVWNSIDVVWKKLLFTAIILIFNLIGCLIYYVFLSPTAREKSKTRDIDDEFIKTLADVMSSESYTPKTFKNLEEFCDYLNRHEKWEWESHLSETIRWNNWTDWTDEREEEDRICSDGCYYISYDRYDGGYNIHRDY